MYLPTPTSHGFLRRICTHGFSLSRCRHCREVGLRHDSGELRLSLSIFPGPLLTSRYSRGPGHSRRCSSPAALPSPSPTWTQTAHSPHFCGGTTCVLYPSCRSKPNRPLWFEVTPPHCSGAPDTPTTASVLNQVLCFVQTHAAGPPTTLRII